LSDPKINSDRKRDLLQRVQKQRLKYIAILPSLITLINGICGFAAICFASKGGQIVNQAAVSSVANEGSQIIERLGISSFAIAGYLIFIAMIADMLDGRVARMSHSTSSFGGQLDSLCDIISFGVAPAFLVFKILYLKLPDIVNPHAFFAGSLQRFIWIAAAVYLVCSAIRLARFNVENEEDETAHMDFIGLPTPAAAGVIASLVVYYEDFLMDLPHESWIFIISEQSIMYLLPFITIAVAVLMISRVIFPHVFNHYLKGRKPLTNLIWVLIAIGLLIWALQITSVVCFCGFALWGYLQWVYQWNQKRKGKGKQDDPPVLSVTNDQENV
jgi:CDP-diacylglycerol--serine O-phosphatidyltransferase